MDLLRRLNAIDGHCQWKVHLPHSTDLDISVPGGATEHNGSKAAIKYLQSLVERDKMALARELHDDLGGYMVATAMDIDALDLRFATHNEESALIFARARHAVHAAIDLLRRITEELRPTLLDNVGLLAALRWQVKAMCRRLAIQCEEHMPDTEPQLTPSGLISIFRAGQESLLVAETQAELTELKFTLSIDEGSLVFTVLTSGSSDPPPEDSRGYVALALLRQRVAAMGGAVSLSRRRVGGIQLAATFPLAEIEVAQEN